MSKGEQLAAALGFFGSAVLLSYVHKAFGFDGLLFVSALVSVFVGLVLWVEINW